MSISFYKLIVSLSSLIFLFACSANQPAPVVELRPQYAMNKTQATYVVRAGDTLYAIAFLFDENYEQLAKLNHISYPYALNKGQIIRLTGIKQTIAPIIHRSSTTSVIRPKMVHHGAWQWPCQGRVASGSIGNAIEKKGITILGSSNQVINASADGVVAYSGDGLPGYGNLILIKHGGNYLTAYAFNSHNLVREGQMVKAGQQIATMGRTDSGQWGLHFEVRYKGNVINPMKFLSSH